MLDGSARFKVACKSCAIQLVVDRIREAVVTAMSDHLREHHPELGVSRAVTLGDVLEHYRVMPPRW